jgi:hypothetical protein
MKIFFRANPKTITQCLQLLTQATRFHEQTPKAASKSQRLRVCVKSNQAGPKLAFFSND